MSVFPLTGFGCGSDEAATEAGAPDGRGEELAPGAFDLCGSFTSVGGACPRAGPARCFPMCQTGGCFCRVGGAGPVWECTIDTSCFPQCAPLDDACAASAASANEAGALGGADDGGSE